MPCDLGNYVRYSVNVSSIQDIVAGIKFAREKNVRLVVKNSGHEYVYLTPMFFITNACNLIVSLVDLSALEGWLCGLIT